MKPKSKLKIVILSFGILVIPIAVLSGLSMIVYGANFPLVKFHYWVGYLEQRNGDLNDAIKSYDEVSRLDKNYPTAYISRGSAYLDLRQYGKAIENYSKAIKLSPLNEEPYAYRARAYYEIDSLEKSKADFDKAILLDENFAYAYLNRAILRYTKLDDFKGGCEDFEMAAKLGSEDAEEYLKDGACK